ncbi:MAG: hypothetical protein RR879_06110 [Hydrogenoanaerobacterium sp.]
MKKQQNKFKKVLALTLCLAASLPLCAFAAKPAEAVQNPNADKQLSVAADAQADEMGNDVIVVMPVNKYVPPSVNVSDEVIIVTPEEKPALPVVSSSDDVIIVTPQENDTEVKRPEKLTVADAAMYRGTVTEIKNGDDSGTLLLTLKRADGTAFMPVINHIEIDTATRLSFDKKTLAVGDYLEVYYGVSPVIKPIPAKEYKKAIAINRSFPAEGTVFNGELVEIMKNDRDGSTSLLLKPIGKGMETVFHIFEDTQIYLDFAKLKKGDKLNVFYNGIATMSIPPQSSALELRYYTKP